VRSKYLTNFNWVSIDSHLEKLTLEKGLKEVRKLFIFILKKIVSVYKCKLNGKKMIIK
jgi:hypothetical protein